MVLTAYVKIKPIKSERHLKQAVDYITNPYKTDGEVYISTNMCSPDFVSSQFAEIRKMAMKKGNNVAHHICQSFSPEDKVIPESAIMLGKKLMENMYPNYQYVIATHVDREHIHNHIIMNSVDYVTYHKLVSNKDTLDELRKISDRLCAECGYSIIMPEDKTKRQALKECIDAAVANSDNLDEFFLNMRKSGYTIKFGKYWSFKRRGDSRYIRSDSIGSAYTAKAIEKSVSGIQSVDNHSKKIYDSHTIYYSKRKRLKWHINNGAEKVNTFDEFIKYMAKCGYEVKWGKHLAFKHNSAKRFVRVQSLGDEYSEEMLRLRFENYPEYLRRKNEIKKLRIDRVICLKNDVNNRYIAAKNVNIAIKTLNYLMENNITCYEQLLQKAVDLQNIINDDMVWEDRKDAARRELRRLDNVVYNVEILADIKPREVEQITAKENIKTTEIRQIRQNRRHDYYER